MSAIASLTAPVAVKAGKSAAFSRGARVSQVRSRRALPNPRGLDRTRRENLISPCASGSRALGVSTPRERSADRGTRGDRLSSSSFHERAYRCARVCEPIV
jgi:hypothetical protein